MKEAGAHAVKMEGGVRMRAAVRACVDAGIPVMGHVGLTPQAVHQLGGFKVQRDADALLADAAAVEEAGAFSVVVEIVPAELGAKARQRKKRKSPKAQKRQKKQAAPHAVSPSSAAVGKRTISLKRKRSSCASGSG